jgi:GTP cyclohydrolase I
MKERKNNMDDTKIKQGAKLIVEGLGFAPDDCHMDRTPQRVLASFQFFYQGMKTKKDILNELNISFPSNYKEPIVLHGLSAQSLCPHHLLPNIYTADFAYLPAGKIVGTSKPYKLFAAIMAQPLTMEDATEEFINEFYNRVKPAGCVVEIKGQLICMQKSGFDCHSTSIITTARRGVILSRSIFK